MHRRRFLTLTAFSALQLSLLGHRSTAAATSSASGLLPAGELLDLPPGFRYKVLQRAGETMTDGYLMPLQPDGMCCIAGPSDTWILLRNHELGAPGLFERFGYRTSWVPEGMSPPAPLYDPGKFGGVSRLVIEPAILQRELTMNAKPTGSNAIRSSNMALGGTAQNCAGGQTPEGWVTCEESDSSNHGWAFLVRPNDDTLKPPRKLTSWGRFKREGIALDPDTGIAYMSEDHSVGCLYRHVPLDPKAPMGEGKVQALALEAATELATQSARGQSWKSHWVDVPDPSAMERPCRTQAVEKGASTFVRTEGILWDGESLWFVCTSGGPIQAGQIFRYTPSNGIVTLVEQVEDRARLSMPDNCALTPWGDLLLAEDNYNAAVGCTHQHLRLLTRTGEIIDLARNRHNVIPGFDAPGSEFAGPCFSPDGSVLFVNLQSPENVTVAITGPWETLRT